MQHPRKSGTIYHSTKELRDQVMQLQDSLHRAGELEEEVKQLRAAVHLYQDLVEKLAIKRMDSARAARLFLPRAS